MPKVLVVGASNVDYVALSNNKLIRKDSNIGKLNITFGGVGRNIVENLAILEDDVSFITFLGNDSFGKELRKDLESINVKIYSPNKKERTSSYLAVLDSNGDMDVAICDTEIIDKSTVEDIEPFDDVISEFTSIVLDANINDKIIDHIFKEYSDKKILVEAVSANKVKRYEKYLDKIYLFKSNVLEAKHLLNLYDAEPMLLAKRLMERGVKNVVITDGGKPVIIGENNEVVFVTPKPIEKIISASGAGDSLFAGLIHGLINGASLVESVAFGIKVSQMTLMVEESVNKDIKKIKDLIRKRDL
ncbi:MAG: carbohydrate kinase family protein [Candidatus Enterosoma sp.]|nr:carbohydrate kinase family protein [Bacilli bacterium]MDD7607428.1 carbohydrate kinase family protein [bacterium]MDY5865580.1 carbohydrate kinase family protein [Candidatus Enterosoma sp.]